MKVTLQEMEKKVEQLRRKLDRLALENKDCLATEELVELSQELDRVLAKWAKLKGSKE